MIEEMCSKAQQLDHIFQILQGLSAPPGRFHENFDRLLGAFGHPERHLPPTIHLTGTNGKGSTIAFMRGCLEAHGYRVHTFTSPHLIDWTERIVLQGKNIDPERLTTFFEKNIAIFKRYPTNVFGCLCLAGFIFFSQVPADVLLLEVGIGGRKDPTNVCERQIASVVTPISLDHTNLLGPTLQDIAWEKAGIFRPNIPVFMGRQLPEVIAFMEQAQAEGGYDITYVGNDQGDYPGKGRIEDLLSSINSPPPLLLGAYQEDNLKLALATLLGLKGFTWQDHLIRKGIECAACPGRLEHLQTPAIKRLFPETEVWVDVGHNRGAAEVLATFIQREKWGCASLDVIFGQKNTKDIKGFIEPLLPFVRSIYSIEPFGSYQNLHSAEDYAFLNELAPDQYRGAMIIQQAIDHVGCGLPPKRLLVCGAFRIVEGFLRQVAR